MRLQDLAMGLSYEYCQKLRKIRPAEGLKIETRLLNPQHVH